MLKRRIPDCIAAIARTEAASVGLVAFAIGMGHFVAWTPFVAFPWTALRLAIAGGLAWRLYMILVDHALS